MNNSNFTAHEIADIEHAIVEYIGHINEAIRIEKNAGENSSKHYITLLNNEKYRYQIILNKVREG